jgi:hypothetical protein
MAFRGADGTETQETREGKLAKMPMALRGDPLYDRESVLAGSGTGS